jgi:phage terminase large subunit
MSILRIETPRAFVPLLAPKRYKGARGGRGSGKSHFFAELLVEEAILGHQRIACLREIQNSIKESVKRLIEDKLVKLRVEHLFSVTEAEIRVPHDSLFIFRGLQNHTAATIKSLEGFTRAWVEEAQTISQRSLDIMTPTFRAPGSEMMFSWNPNKRTDPIEKLFLSNEDDDSFTLVRVGYADNPWFPDELRTDMERDKRRHVEAATWQRPYIYVVKGEHNMVKIGITTNLDARLAQLRTGSAFPIDYAFTAPASADAYAIGTARTRFWPATASTANGSMYPPN